jgi:hypothetical protein
MVAGGPPQLKIKTPISYSDWGYSFGSLSSAGNTQDIHTEWSEKIFAASFSDFSKKYERLKRQSLPYHNRCGEACSPESCMSALLLRFFLCDNQYLSPFFQQDELSRYFQEKYGPTVRADLAFSTANFVEVPKGLYILQISLLGSNPAR